MKENEGKENRTKKIYIFFNNLFNNEKIYIYILYLAYK